MSRHPNGILCDDPADYDDDGRAEFEYREKQMEAQKVATIGEPAELWGIWYSGSPPGWMKHGLSSAIVLFERKVDAESHNRITSSDEPHCYHVRRYHPPEPAPEPQHPLLAAIDRLAKDPDIPQQLMLELEEIAEPLCRNHEEMRTMLKRISDIKHISHYEPEIYDEIHDLLAKEPQ